MSTITTILGADTITASRSTINTNFTNLNLDKLEGPVSSVDSEVALFSGTGGKTLKRGNTLTGLYKLVAGVFTTALNSDLPTMTATVGGAVPTPPNNTTTFLRGDGTFATPSGSGDMVLASAQTNSGLKTFLDATFGLRNVANTFTGLFTNAITATRTWTLPDVSGTLVTGGGTASGTNTGDETTARINTLYGTTNAITVGSVELGNASDTTLSRSAAGTLAVEGIRVKTTTPLVLSAASYTTDTGTSLNMDNLDIFIVTAQAGALLFNSPGGTLVQGRQLIIRIKDNGTARALTWNAIFRAMGTSLPSTTVLSKTLYLGFMYNSTDTKWDLIASAQEA